MRSRAVASSRWPVSADAPWRHLIGVSYVAFALVWPAIYAPDVVAGTISGQNLLVFIVATVGALSLVLYGIDVARGGRHFTVTPDVELTLGG